MFYKTGRILLKISSLPRKSVGLASMLNYKNKIQIFH